MPLVDRRIKAACRTVALVHPYEEDLVNPASIDVRIGTTARIEVPISFWSKIRNFVGGVVERVFGRDFGVKSAEKPHWSDLDLTGYSVQNPYYVKPKEFVLVGTFETFNLTPTLVAEFRLKSSRAREGWNNCLAVWADNGWAGSVLTMELINECRYHSLPLYPGLRIGQMIFHESEAPDKHYGLTGRYNGDRTVMGSKG